MKKLTTLIASLIIISFSYVLFSYNIESTEYDQPMLILEDIEIPENVQLIFDNKCIRCHSAESKTSKSKSKLNFDKFTNGDYSTSKLVSKIGKISKQINKNGMPPKKFLAKNPDKKLTEEESKLIIDWATEQQKILVGE